MELQDVLGVQFQQQEPLLPSLLVIQHMGIVRLLVLLRCWRQLRELQLVLLFLCIQVEAMEMGDGTGTDVLIGGTMLMERG